MFEATSISVKSVNLYQTTRCYNPATVRTSKRTLPVVFTNTEGLYGRKAVQAGLQNFTPFNCHLLSTTEQQVALILDEQTAAYFSATD
jgi:hypothetical protein